MWYIIIKILDQCWFAELFWLWLITKTLNLGKVSKIILINLNPRDIIHLIKMTNLCFIFFFKISLEHILLSQDCLKCCQRPNNQWHMQLKSWLIFNNHTSRQLNYCHKEQKNQLLRTPRLGCKKSTTFYASSFKDEEETKSSDKWCQIPENQWHIQLKWYTWLPINSTTVTKNRRINFSGRLNWVAIRAQHFT